MTPAACGTCNGTRRLPGGTAVCPDCAETPNPGSDEAKARGCTCAVLDNNHGRYPPWIPDGWWITEGCPLHDPRGLA